MLIAQAHSFEQQARLAVTLAWIAGYTNVVSIIAFGVPTSHVSGTTSQFGLDLVEAKWGLAILATTILVAFYIGATISGLFQEYARRRGWESIYVLPTALQAALLFLFGLGLNAYAVPSPGEYGLIQYLLVGTAAAAMGLQNATITRISSGVVRTTHVTGVLTDLGLDSALFTFWAWDKRRNVSTREGARMVLRSARNHPSTRRILLLIAIMGSFALGGTLGTLLYGAIPRWVMVPPVLFLVWIVIQDTVLPIAEIEQSELMDDSAGLDLPATLAIYHVHKDTRRRGASHRMPNLLAWADRLPPKIRVVILDLGHEAQLDINAAMDVRAVISLMKRQGRRLILAGLNEQEFTQLRVAAPEELEPSDVCVDMEMALIHAMTIAPADGSGEFLSRG
ncbi:DUF1275 domain-containing protein [bacterium]|nr:DUF1275 domain-containing protein [bacterium]